MYRFSKKILFNALKKSLFKKQKPKILLVEDGILNQKIFMTMLNFLGYRVGLAINGKQALAMHQDYEAILLDYQLPDMTALEICQVIRKQEKPGIRIPILVATCHEKQGMQQQCLAMGADQLLKKPVLIESLRRALQSFVI